MKNTLIKNIKSFQIISFSKLFENYEQLYNSLNNLLCESDICFGSNPMTLILLEDLIVFFNDLSENEYTNFIENNSELLKITELYVDLES